MRRSLLALLVFLGGCVTLKRRPFGYDGGMLWRQWQRTPHSGELLRSVPLPPRH